MKNVPFVIAVVLVSLSIFVVKWKKNDSEIKKAPSAVVFGIDFSGYQGSNLNWNSIAKSKHPIEFIILRGTRGDDRLDSAFLRNFANAKARGYTVGFYHYIDPNEDFREQAKNYLKMSKLLIKGDFIPIIDIESLPKGVTSRDTLLVDTLKMKLKWMLDTVQKVHGVKPILYTGLKFYKEHLNDSVFGAYPHWLAAYSEKRRGDSLIQTSMIYQFNDSIRVKGIPGYVDGNDIRRTAFDSLLMK